MNSTAQELIVGPLPEGGRLAVGSEPGPAGVNSLVLADARLSFDGADPRRLVELVVMRSELSSLRADTKTLLEALFVDDASGLFEDGTVSVEPSPTLDALSALAAAEMRCRVDRRSPALSALSSVTRASLELPGFEELIRDRVVDCLGAVNALGRAAARHPELTDRLSSEAKLQLAGHLDALVDALDSLGAPRRQPLLDLHDLLLRVSDEELARTVQDWRDPALLRGYDVGAFSASPQVVSIDLEWSTTDAGPRLGSLADYVLGNIKVSGEVSGQSGGYIEVDGDLVPGATAREVSWLVRIYSWSGVLLGEAPLTINDSAVLGALNARVPIGPLGSESLMSITESQVYVEIAPVNVPRLSEFELRALARSVAHRHGQLAQVAELNGESESAQAHWLRCAKFLRAVGEEGSANLARASLPGTRPDWIGQVLESWLAELERAASGPDTGALVQEVQDASFAAAEWPGLVPAHLTLASRYESGSSVDFAIGHYEEALRIATAVGDATTVVRSRQAINRLATGAAS